MFNASLAARGLVRAGGLVLSATLAACAPGGSSIEPKILTFNYMLLQYPDPAALIADLNSGQRTVAGEMPADPCNFTADAAASTPLSIDLLGTPGSQGFNVTITSATLANLTTTNAPACRNVTEINMTIGGLNESLGVGGTTNMTGASLLAGGDRFETTGNFFQGSLGSYSGGYGTGEFQFAATSSATGANSVLLVSGSWADD